MKTTKNEALLILAQMIMDTRLKPMIDKATSIERTIKPIPVNTALYENDYAEYLASKENKLVHIHNRKEV